MWGAEVGRLCNLPSKSYPLRVQQKNLRKFWCPEILINSSNVQSRVLRGPERKSPECRTVM